MTQDNFLNTPSHCCLPGNWQSIASWASKLPKYKRENHFPKKAEHLGLLLCHFTASKHTHTASVPILTCAREIHQFLRSLCCSWYLRLPNNIASVNIKYMNKSISYFYLFPSLLHFFHSNVFDLPPTHTPTQWHGGGILCPRFSGEKEQQKSISSSELFFRYDGGVVILCVLHKLT